jgi:hypothetical protein
MSTNNDTNKSIFAQYIEGVEKEPPVEDDQTRREQLEARLDALAADLRFRSLSPPLQQNGKR